MFRKQHWRKLGNVFALHSITFITRNMTEDYFGRYIQSSLFQKIFLSNMIESKKDKDIATMLKSCSKVSR